VRILQPPAEGKLVHGAGGVDLGDRIRVKLIGVDVERGFIDFARTAADRIYGRDMKARARDPDRKLPQPYRSWIESGAPLASGLRLFR
jgi:exoribonuclease-2